MYETAVYIRVNGDTHKMTSKTAISMNGDIT